MYHVFNKNKVFIFKVLVDFVWKIWTLRWNFAARFATVCLPLSITHKWRNEYEMRHLRQFTIDGGCVSELRLTDEPRTKDWLKTLNAWAQEAVRPYPDQNQYQFCLRLMINQRAKKVKVAPFSGLALFVVFQ